MDAMILAAGLGTRLRPLTERVPKPLLPVAGVPMLERIARRLIAAGADRLIINTHHLAEQIASFVRERDGFGAEVVLSNEPDEPLGTGGALVHAAHALRRDEPFFLHNSDVLTDIDLEAMHRAHIADQSEAWSLRPRHARSDASAEDRPAGPSIATLAVLDPSPERYLLFDDEGLFGVALREGGERTARGPTGTVRRFDFAGVHVIEPRMLDRIAERGAFSIIWTYLRLVAEGERIGAYHARAARWLDIGSPEKLAAAQGLAAQMDRDGRR